MTTSLDPISWYDARAGSIADRYEALQPERLHDWLEGLHLPAPAPVLDVGAGSGHDAAWLAGFGMTWSPSSRLPLCGPRPRVAIRIPCTEPASSRLSSSVTLR